MSQPFGEVKKLLEELVISVNSKEIQLLHALFDEQNIDI